MNSCKLNKQKLLMTKTKRMILHSVLVAIALVIYLDEAQIPVLFPGIKLGLAILVFDTPTQIAMLATSATAVAQGVRWVVILC